MEEKKKNETINFEEIIRERLNEIIKQKEIENKEAVGKLDMLETSWNKINKSFEDEIKAEIDLVSKDEQTMVKTKTLLKKGPSVVGQEDMFAISGKVVEAESGVGVPSLLIKILESGEREKRVLAEASSDHYGNFTFSFSGEDLQKIQGTKILTFHVYSDTKTLVHSEDVQMQVRPGGIKSVTLSIPASAAISDRLEAGKALGESVEKDDELVNSRMSEMKEVHTTLKRLRKVSFEELQKLKEELSGTPPLLPPLPEEPAEGELEEGEEFEPPKQYYYPGETCQISGQYRNTATGKEVTVVKGEPFPPTPKPGQQYVLIDITKHKEAPEKDEE